MSHALPTSHPVLPETLPLVLQHGEVLLESWYREIARHPEALRCFWEQRPPLAILEQVAGLRVDFLAWLTAAATAARAPAGICRVQALVPPSTLRPGLARLRRLWLRQGMPPEQVARVQTAWQEALLRAAGQG